MLIVIVTSVSEIFLKSKFTIINLCYMILEEFDMKGWNIELNFFIAVL